MVFLHSIQAVFSILIMIFIGSFLTYKKWFNEGTSRLFSNMVVNLSLPAYMIYNIMTVFTRDKLINAASGVIIPFLSILFSYLIASCLCRILKISDKRRGVFKCMFAFSNTIFIGLPINTALFGQDSIPFVLLYYAANTTLFWTVGIYGLRRDGEKGKGIVLNESGIKKILSPPLTAFLAALAMVLLNLRLPGFIMDSCKYIGDMTTPISMLFIGILIYNIGIRKVKFDMDMVWVMAGRFVVSPLIVLGMTAVVPIPGLMRDVFIIQSALPIMTQTAIVAGVYNSDSGFAAVMATVTTIASMILIPFIMFIMNI